MENSQKKCVFYNFMQTFMKMKRIEFGQQHFLVYYILYSYNCSRKITEIYSPGSRKRISCGQRCSFVCTGLWQKTEQARIKSVNRKHRKKLPALDNIGVFRKYCLFFSIMKILTILDYHKKIDFYIWASK